MVSIHTLLAFTWEFTLHTPHFCCWYPATAYSGNLTELTYKHTCYVCGVLVIKEFLLSAFHIFTTLWVVLPSSFLACLAALRESTSSLACDGSWFKEILRELSKCPRIPFLSQLVVVFVTARISYSLYYRYERIGMNSGSHKRGLSNWWEERCLARWLK